VVVVVVAKFDEEDEAPAGGFELEDGEVSFFSRPT